MAQLARAATSGLGGRSGARYRPHARGGRHARSRTDRDRSCARKRSRGCYRTARQRAEEHRIKKSGDFHSGKILSIEITRMDLTDCKHSENNVPKLGQVNAPNLLL